MDISTEWLESDIHTWIHGYIHDMDISTDIHIHDKPANISRTDKDIQNRTR